MWQFDATFLLDFPGTGGEVNIKVLDWEGGYEAAEIKKRFVLAQSFFSPGPYDSAKKAQMFSRCFLPPFATQNLDMSNSYWRSVTVQRLRVAGSEFKPHD